MNKVVDYYNKTAQSYDAWQDASSPEHVRALERLVPHFFADCQSVLDVGCGTGRALNWFSEQYPDMALSGLDPSEKLLGVAADKVPAAQLHQGGGETLPFDDDSHDLVTMTGILHHIEDSKAVIREAFRVARRGVLISDHNNFAFGSTKARKLRLFLYSVGLLSLATYVKQGFSKQGYSEDDGYWYPYSLYTNFDVIADLSDLYYVVPTTRRNSRTLDNLQLTTSHIAVACLKKHPSQ